MAFAAGLVSFLSPCVLPLVPGYVSFVAGRSLESVVHTSQMRDRGAIMGLASCFVLGFSIIFIALGASASVVGQLLRSYLFEAGYVAGAVIALFGLHMMGVLRLGWLTREWRFHGALPGGRPLGAFLLGSAFAFGWTPCIGPILGAILTLSAVEGEVSKGAALLAIYSLGLAIPFLVVAAFTGRFMLAFGRLKRLAGTLQTVAGGLLVLAGIGMATGYLNVMGTWLLNSFPVFQDILL